MLDYSDFYDIAVYGNENWKGSFTPKEIAYNAFVYCMDYRQSAKKDRLTSGLSSLLEMLKEDKRNSEIIGCYIEDKVEYWIEEIEQIVNC